MRLLKKNAYHAIEVLLSDTSVKKETTRGDMRELRDFIILALESLDESDEEQGTK
jgi:hypothetical protein